LLSEKEKKLSGYITQIKPEVQNIKKTLSEQDKSLSVKLE